MKIIDQRHEIISLPDNILHTIEAAARTCYKSEDKIGCTYSGSSESIKRSCAGHKLEKNGVCKDTDCEYHSSQKIVKMLINRHHDAMLEFGEIIVRFVTNRGVTHELVRHRIGVSYAQKSTRYIRYDGNMEFIRPVWLCHELCGDWEGDFPKNLSESEYIFFNSCVSAEINYSQLLKQNWRPEMAREVLPNSLETEIMVKTNIREWRHILNLRCSKKAHPQIRALMLPLLAELKERVPVVFDDIYPEKQ